MRVHELKTDLGVGRRALGVALLVLAQATVAQNSGSGESGALTFAGETRLANVRQITFGGENAEAYFSFDGSELIFQATRGERQCDAIYRMDADGGHLEKLSNNSVSESAPSVMNDGRILYTRWEYVDNESVTNKGLWAMRPDAAWTAALTISLLAIPATFGPMIAGIVAALGGWPAVGGLATAAIAGVWIGFSPSLGVGTAVSGAVMDPAEEVLTLLDANVWIGVDPDDLSVMAEEEAG